MAATPDSGRPQATSAFSTASAQRADSGVSVAPAAALPVSVSAADTTGAAASAMRTATDMPLRATAIAAAHCLPRL